MMTPDWLSSDVAVWLVQSLAHVLWQGIALLIIAGVADALLKNRSSQTRYALWSIALLLIFCCLPANLVVLAPSLAETAAESQLAREDQPTEELASVPGTGSSMPPGTGSARTTPVVNAATQAANMAAFAGPADKDVQRTGAVAANVPRAPVDARNVWQAAAPFACIVYVFGVGIMLVRLLLAAGGTRRLRRSCRPIDDPRLLEQLDSLARRVGLRVRPLVATSAKVAVPVVVGIVKPVIMLPGCVLSGLDPAQLEAILLHELAHIRRCDPLINLLQRCAETVLFFHPAVWIISRRIRVLREDCCDDLVLQCDVPQCLYAESLVSVSELRDGTTPVQSLALAAVNPAERSLRRRVLRILGEGHESGRLNMTRAAVLTLAVLIVLSLSPVLLFLQSAATGQDDDVSPQTEAIRKLIGSDPGESIYNDKLKRFKFRLEKVEVHTAETAKAFCSLYRDGEQATGRPKLIGAWGDPLTNSLVVIGPPEAEQAIRETLAEWESAMVGIEGLDETLEVKQEYLQRERRTLIHDIASIELVVVEIDNAGDLPDSDKRMKVAKERLRAFESELQRVEQQLEVISRNIRRRDGVSGSETDSPDGQPAPRGTANRQPSDKKTDPVLTTAHAVVVWRNDGVVWINRGTADRMKRGLRLNVTSSIGGPAKPQFFGRIEITRIVGEHLSEARVLQEEPGRPIAKGDQIAWLAEVRQIPLTLAPLEPGTVILQDHIGMGPWPVSEIPADAQLSAPDFIGRVVRNRIDVVQPIREQDLCRRGEFPPSTGISFSDLKLVDEKVPEPIRRLIGRHVTISGLMFPPFMDTGIKRFVLSADRQINHFARIPEPHELVSVRLAPGLSTDYVQDAIRVFGVLGAEPIPVEDGGGIRYALKAAHISDVSPKSEATGTSPPATLGQQQSPQAVTQFGASPVSLPVLDGVRQTNVQLKFSGPIRAIVQWPADPGKDETKTLRFVLPATIPVTTGKTVAFPVTDLPGKDGVQLFASIEMASASRHTAVYLKHNAIPLMFGEEDIDQAVSGNLVTKVVFLPRPEFQELALAGVETLVTSRLDPGVDPVVEAKRRGHVLAVLRLGNRQ